MHEEDRVLEAVELALRQARLSLLRVRVRVRSRSRVTLTLTLALALTLTLALTEREERVHGAHHEEGQQEDDRLLGLTASVKG